jgi:hypothetical protein
MHCPSVQKERCQSATEAGPCDHSMHTGISAEVLRRDRASVGWRRSLQLTVRRSCRQCALSLRSTRESGLPGLLLKQQHFLLWLLWPFERHRV